MRILPDAGTDRQFALYGEGDKIIAWGSYALCEARRDGKVAEYISACAAERERLGIGRERRPRKAAKVLGRIDFLLPR